MVDIEKLQTAVHRIHKRRLSEREKDGARAIYLRVRAGRRKAGAGVVWSSAGDDIADREAADLIEEIAQILDGGDNDEPKAWIEAMYAGTSNPIHCALVMTREEMSPIPNTAHNPNAGAGVALNRALSVIEAMAREAMIRADSADKRAQQMFERQLDQAIRIRELELEQAQGGEVDPMTIATAELAPRLSQAIGLMLAKKAGALPGPTASGTTPAPPEHVAQEDDDSPRGQAAGAILLLRDAVTKDPRLLEDPELVESMTPIVMQAMGLTDQTTG